MKRKISSLLLALALLISVIPAVGAASNSDTQTGGMPYELWYSEPAQNSYAGWEHWSLPIGNSAIGGNVFGRYDTERITLNEKTMWTGGPSKSRPDYDGGNMVEKAKNGEALKDIQKRFLSGDPVQMKEASDMCGRLLTGEGDAGGFGSYSLFGNLYMNFGHTNVSNYRRSLNIMDGIAAVGYNVGATRYEREYFVSYPDNVMVIHLTADGEEKLNFDLSMIPSNEEAPDKAHNPLNRRTAQDARRSVTTTGTDTELQVAGQLNDNQLRYNGLLQVRVDGAGKSVKEGDSLKISNANEVTILLNMATDYQNEYPAYRTGEDDAELAARVRGVLDGVKNKSYEQLRKTHVEDVSSMMDRVDLNLGQSLPNIPTHELLNKYKKDQLSRAEMSYLEVLLYQYGRYLLVSSSRGNTLPANLQGMWVGYDYNKWASDYHINVNLQMNYWPAYSANLHECALPLLDYVDKLRVPGRKTAEIYFGVKSTTENPENGFTANTQNNPYGWTAPGQGFGWGWSPAAVPWLLQNVYEYYEYTGDLEMLKNVIYPIMKEETKFYQQIMVKDNGKWISCPGASPEHGPKTKTNTYEMSEVWQLFHDTIEAGKLVGEDPQVLAQWQDVFENLRDPIEIGEDGQIKEWYEETTFGSCGGELQHRHLSHMLGLFPGDLISEETPEWLEAAKVSMDMRGDKSTGWAMGQRINSWARLRDGERAYKTIQNLLKGGITNNLWDEHPPFQIDGNFGYTSGVNEMLAESHQGYIDILPTLPPDWESGSINGIIARGNFELGLDWSEGRPTEIRLISHNGGPVQLQFHQGTSYTITDSNGKTVTASPVAGKENRIAFDTEKGVTYTVHNELPLAAPRDVVALRQSHSAVAVSWKPVQNADSYHVYRCQGETCQLVAANVPQASYEDLTATELRGEAEFSYFIAAVDQNGKEGEKSKPVTAKWDDGTDTRVTVSSINGQTRFLHAGETIQLAADVQTSGSTKAVTWTLTDTKGNPIAPEVATIDQTGLVTAVGQLNLTMIAKAVSEANPTCSGTLELTMSTSTQKCSDNYFLHQSAELVGSTLLRPDLNEKWLTNGDSVPAGGPQRLAVSTPGDLTVSVTMDDVHRIDQIVVYERIDTKYGDHSRIQGMQLLTEENGTWNPAKQLTYTTEITDNNVMKHVLTVEPVEAATVRVKMIRNEEKPGQGITLWEMEGYDSNLPTEETTRSNNYFFRETFQLAEGQKTLTGKGPDYLTDGKTAITDPAAKGFERFAMADGDKASVGDASMSVTMTKDCTIDEVIVFERIDENAKDLSRMNGVQIFAPGSDKPAEPKDYTSETIQNNIQKHVLHVAPIEIKKGDILQVKLLRNTEKTNSGITVWEIEAYNANLVIPATDRSHLIEALNKAALVVETDFAPEAWESFQKVRAEAIAVANKLEASQDEINAATQKLEDAMKDITTLKKSVGLEINLPALTMGVGGKQSIRVMELFDRGPSKDCTETAKLTVQGDAVSLENFVLTAVKPGTVTVKAAYQGHETAVEVKVLADPIGQLHILCDADGVVTHSPEGPYTVGQEITLRAEPVGKNTFDHWEITHSDGTTETKNSNPLTVPMEAELTVKAVFQPPVHGHDLEEVKTVPAGCVDAGVEAHWKCKTCGLLFRDAQGQTAVTLEELKLKPLGHQWDEGYVSVEPHDGEDGERTYTCTRCGATRTETIPAENPPFIPPYNPGVPVKPEVKPELNFADVSQNDWFYDSVYSAWENNLLDGMTDTEFAPNGTLTVAQTIKLAAALHQRDKLGAVTLCNGTEQWYSTYVNYAIANGVIEKVYADYTPAQMNAPVSRREFVKILHGANDFYAEKNTVVDNAIPDVKLTDKNGAEIYEFYRAGILTGSDEHGTFYPETSIKRSEAATILVRMYDVTVRETIMLP